MGYCLHSSESQIMLLLKVVAAFFDAEEQKIHLHRPCPKFFKYILQVC